MRRPSPMLGLVFAVCLAQAHADDNLAVKGEVSPERATAATASAATTLRLAELGALDAAVAITLAPLGQQQSSAMTESRQGGGPLRIGFHRDLPDEYRGDLAPLLRWVTDDGSMIAAATVTSPGAVRVRLAIRADLPPRARIRFFGGEPAAVVGAIDRSDLPHSAGHETPEALWSPSVSGDTIGLEITVPSSDARGEVAVEIDRVSHQFRTLGPAPPAPQTKNLNTTSQLRDHLQCSHVDIRCRDVGRTANAVAGIVFEKGRDSHVCSGTLMNDDGGSGFMPYFLTANHCVSTQAVAATVESRWFFHVATCGGTTRDPRFTTTHGGADLLATSVAQDSTLLRLGGQLPGGLYLSGWDTNYVDGGQSVYGIHHPGGHEKKYVAGITGPAAPVFRPCVDPANPDTCFNVENAIPIEVDDGATEPGSSGSGLFRSEYLVGVLSGNPLDNSCSRAYYGRFSDFFPEIRQWLRPDRGRFGAVTVQPRSLQIPEGGGKSYALRLGLRPNATVTITARISGDRDLWVSPTRVTFTLEDWASPRRITVHAAEDSDHANGSATISHTVTSRDAAYHGIRVATVTATERDSGRRAGTVTGVSARATGEAGELEVSWNAVAGADAYIVEWRQRHQSFSPGRRQVVRGGATTTTLTDLDGDTVHIVRVIATAEGLRDGIPSGTVSVTTPLSHRPLLRGWLLGLFDVATRTPIAVP